MRSDTERKIAIRLRKEGKSYTNIGIILYISRNSARNLCRTLKIDKKKPGPRPKIGRYQQVCIKREVSKLRELGQKVNSTKIKKNCALKTSTRSVRRFLKNKLNMKYKRIAQTVCLKKAQCQKRMEVIEQWIQESVPWKMTVFTDEKVFSLDGPDDHRTYVLKNECTSRQKRVCGGGKIMVWLMALPNGLLSYRIFRGTFNSDKYLDLLKDKMISVIKLNMCDFILQQDNSRIHTAKIVQQYLRESAIKTLIWPPYSCDLNIVEDIWSKISYDVYDNFQFNNSYELEERIKFTIHNINCFRKNEILELFSSVPGRLIKVLKKSGQIWNK